MEGTEGIGTGIAGTDIDTEDIGIGIVDIGSNSNGVQVAEEQARELGAAEANREAQAVGTTRNPQRATLSKRSLRPRTCGMFSYGSFHSRHARSTPCFQPSTWREGRHSSAEDLELCLEAGRGYSWGMVRRWRRLMITGGILLLAILALWMSLSKKLPQVIFNLPDGTSLQLEEAVHGKELRFHKDISLEKVLFALGAHPLDRFRSYEESFPASNTNGSLGIELRHSRVGKIGTLPITARVKLAQIISPTNELAGNLERLSAGGWKASAQIFGIREQSYADYYWLFPISRERNLHFRVYYKDPVTHVDTTNDFTIPNPVFK